MAPVEPRAKPERERPATATITVGIDGRVYLHDVTAEMLAVAAAICPEAPAIVSRQAAASGTERKNHDRDPDSAEKE